MNRVAAVVAGFMLLFVAGMQGTAAAGPDKSGAAIAFAHVSPNGSIAAFGGKGTRSATGSYQGVGSYQVTFTGKYPKTITAGSLIINSTAMTTDYLVSNAFIMSASRTQIVVGVYDWRSYDATPVDDDVYVTLYYGR